MDYVVLILIALGLSADAFAVSVTSGAIFKKFHVPHALRIAAFFGGFQAIMPIIGWLAGTTLQHYIANYDHWIAFGLLMIIGGKMVYESFKIKEAQENFDPSNVLVLLTLAIATSIDALAVGVTLSLMSISILVSVLIIGAITFVLSFLGVYIGRRFGHFFESKIEAIGGIVLILIGVKILIDHLK